MSTTFTPARPSVAGLVLHATGLVLGKACRFSIDLYRELAANKGSVPVRRPKTPSLPKQPVVPVRKPRNTFSMEEMERVPTVLRYEGMSASEWYEHHVLNAVCEEETTPEPDTLSKEDENDYFDEIFGVNDGENHE